MLSRMRRMRRLAGALAVALPAVVSMTCMADDARTPAQRACCAEMAHHCGDAAIKQDCCNEHAQSQDSMAALKALGVTAPSVVLVSVLDIPVPAFHDSVVASSTTVKPPGTPTYVLVSAFRI